MSSLAIKPSPPRLSNMEVSVLLEVVRMKRNKQIAQDLNRSVRTIDTYIRRLFHKLGVRSRVALAIWGLRNGFDEP